MRYARVTNEQIRSRLDDTIVWFERVLGRPLGSSRLGELRDKLDEIEQVRANPETRDRLFDYVDRVVAYYSWTDALSFVRIWQAFESLSDQVLPRRLLQRATHGALSPADETTADSDSRNVLAQLEFAADIALKGLHPVAFEDLEFDFGDCRYIAECKRLWSNRRTSVHRNLRKAYDQLHSALNECAARVRRGLVVFAIERVADLNLRLPMETPVRGGQDVLALTRRIGALFDEHYLQSAPLPTDIRIVGLVLVAKVLVHTTSDNTFGPVYVPTFIPLVRRSTKDFRRLVRLTNHLRPKG